MGTRRSRLWATVIAVLAIAGVMTTQQIGALKEEKVDETKVVAPEPGDQYLLSSGMTVKLVSVMKSLQGGSLKSDEAEMLAGSIENGAATPVDRFRAMVVMAEVAGADAALKKLDTTEKEIDYPGSKDDVATLRTILEGRGGELSDTARSDLTTRHGYYGRLALTLGLPDTDPARAPFLKGSGALLAFLAVLCVLAAGVAIASLVCCVIMIVKIANKRLGRAFVPPAPGGSVYMEMVAALAVGFLVLQLGGGTVVHLVFKDNPERALLASLAMQWLLLPVIFWPVLRGVPFAEHRRRVGWTSGRGVAREVGAGVFGYLASLPLFVLVIAVMLVALLVYEMAAHGGKATPPAVKNEILEILSKGNPLVLAMFFLLATIWAPIVEESIFRGALFRHLRGETARLGAASVVASVGVSALAFSVMHGYAFFMLAPVFALGAIFAFMREWRGSLVASITAHALHNGTLLAMAITLLTLARAE